MDILHRLQDKALLLFAQHRNGAGPPTESLRISPEQDGNADELAIFSGQNRSLISRMPSQKSPSAADETPVATYLSSDPTVTFHSPPSASSQPSRSSANFGMMEMPDIHPSLMEYMSGVPQAGTGSMNHKTSTNSFPASRDQPLPIGVPNSSHFMPASEFPPFQMPADLTPEEFPYRDFSAAFLDSTSVDPQQPYAETLATDPWDALSSANGIDDDWVMFLKESGL
ncbi:hypothetical protein FIBSPDRAFT_428414 [Athelia psychrophila]|uniref:Uncharacterized protein n=1 Tax=Athelia psychrophila TaxID=1759441 RepID=A0A167ULP0_9AGAM|nr:hypothetical protein FIBSPDRAFT_428414 [Fibularhizoctonia sp. CBS 109695]